MLISQHDGKIANLNSALGVERTDATLSQIKNKAKHSKTGKPRSMGDELARKIETKLNLPFGWMDQPIDRQHNNFVNEQKSDYHTNGR